MKSIKIIWWLDTTNDISTFFCERQINLVEMTFINISLNPKKMKYRSLAMLTEQSFIKLHRLNLRFT